MRGSTLRQLVWRESANGFEGSDIEVYVEGVREVERLWMWRGLFLSHSRSQFWRARISEYLPITLDQRIHTCVLRRLSRLQMPLHRSRRSMCRATKPQTRLTRLCYRPSHRIGRHNCLMMILGACAAYAGRNAGLILRLKEVLTPRVGLNQSVWNRILCAFLTYLSLCLRLFRGK
jgi:hypothetical protein